MVATAVVVMAVTAVMARGGLGLSPATAMVATGVEAMAATARGLLMLSLRLMPLLRLVTAAAMVVMVVMAAAMAAMAAMAVMARGRLRLSPATAMDAAMAATDAV